MYVPSERVLFVDVSSPIMLSKTLNNIITYSRMSIQVATASNKTMNSKGVEEQLVFFKKILCC